MMMLEEVKAHLLNDIIPFWKNLRDDEFGGYYGYMDYDLKVDKKAVKGCILSHGSSPMPTRFLKMRAFLRKQSMDLPS